MTTPVKVVHEERRGCGFRTPGGLYLVCEGPGRPCCKLPLELTVCPTCRGGIKPSRGWTWVEADELLFSAWEGGQGPAHCLKPLEEQLSNPCPLSKSVGKVGLLWVGEKYYPRPVDFALEAHQMGISRRIPHLPQGFKPGETWVWLAHRKGITRADAHVPAVFWVFRPEQVEYVVKGDETEEELQRFIGRGITPVRVIPAEPLMKEAANA